MMNTMNTDGLAPLTDDEAALLCHIMRWGSDGYPVERRGRRWAWREWCSVKGAPVPYKTKREAVAAFEGWLDLALARWREMKRQSPDAILTGVGVRIPGAA